MANRNNSSYKREYIVEGNVVRQPQEVTRRAPRRDYKSREQLRREANKRHAAHRNRQAAMSMNKGYVAFLTAATVVCFSACAMLVYMQSEVTRNMSEIATLETQISEQRIENTAVEKRMETQMNLSEVKEKAEMMGLGYPDPDQIEYYTVENSDYMNQYGEIAPN